MLAHRDLPFPYPNWNRVENNPGFPESMQVAIDAVPFPGDSRYDCAYTIAWPYWSPPQEADKALSFMTGEFGFAETDFVGQASDLEAFYRGDNRIVTPSHWSKEKLVEHGFPDEKVSVIPHGVSPELFFPATEYERQLLRQQVSVTPEEFLFLNLGAMSWNKGIDVLIPAFIEIRRRHPRARLVMKDDQALYGLSVVDVIHRILMEKGLPLSDDLRQSITLISTTLSLPQLRSLYAMADAYVAPYRAEGFNLPVIEAIASGTPVIVTDGGATDDFCDPRTARFIRSQRVDNTARNLPRKGYHLEPDHHSLVQQMEAALTASPAQREVFEEGRRDLLEKFSWSVCARQLADLF
jgi:glycosyltransferase involved in cell wall biosynthesis